MSEAAAVIRDVSEADFQADVIDRSREVPVVVDFWAEWCGPCRALGPALEKAVSDRGGKVELAKVDVDSNQRLAAAFRVQGIPAVKAFKDGQVAAEFTGAVPPAQIERFLDGLAPNEAELEARQELEEARRLLAGGEAEQAVRLLEPLADGDFAAAGLLARARLLGAQDPPYEAFNDWDEGRHEIAFESLLAEIGAAEGDRRDLLRQVMVGWFTELGPHSALAADYRRRLAAALN